MRRPIHITRSVDVQLTPYELAAEFCELEHVEQAQSLRAIATTVAGYEGIARHMVSLMIGRELHQLMDREIALEFLRDIIASCGPASTEPF